MNAAGITGNAAPEEPAALEGGLDLGLETDRDHVRAVWALAALTALDDIRAESAPGGDPAGPGDAQVQDRSRPGGAKSGEAVVDAPGERASALDEPLAAAAAGAGRWGEPLAGAGRSESVTPRAPAHCGDSAGTDRPGGGPLPTDTLPAGAPCDGTAAAADSPAGGRSHGESDSPDAGGSAPAGAEGGTPVPVVGFGAGGVDDVVPRNAGGSLAAGSDGAGDRPPRRSAPGAGDDVVPPSTDRAEAAPADGAPVRDRFRRGGGPVRAAGRRGGVDPVKRLIHRHRELCEHAVDPLEIAAGLEAHGVTDRTAARFRHRDVFSLAEEMFARAERISTAEDRPARAADSRAGRAGLHLGPLLPGAVCALAVAGMAATEGAARLAVGALGMLATGFALLFALRRGPLRARGRTLPAVRLWTLLLLAHAACGQGLLGAIAASGPDGLWSMSPAPLVALALAVAPAAWCAHLFSVRARRRLGTSRGLDDFATGTRPLLLAVLLLYVGALGGIVALTGLVLPDAGTLAPVVLGTLFFLARLLVVHGFPEPASAALAAACAVEMTAPALLLSGGLPGLDLVARPVEALVGAGGVAAVPVLACGAAALGLAVHAFAVLARASAHSH
ncbi:hypothetical protein [Streptomyces sp. NPDC018833]|uniref:hypothetical protein n=1 Tax=Streptomyces sp. NPDC018833 TaxID=3365053 RepID=UPI0037B68E65